MCSTKSSVEWEAQLNDRVQIDLEDSHREENYAYNTKLIKDMWNGMVELCLNSLTKDSWVKKIVEMLKNLSTLLEELPIFGTL